MKRRNPSDANAGADEAARWYVRLDSGSEPEADAELAAWLAAQPKNERAMERVELAAGLGRRLAADPSSALYSEAVSVVGRGPRGASFGRKLAWGGALAATLLVAVFIVRDRSPSAIENEPVALTAARVVAFDAPSTAVAVLPSGAVVDASAVVLLPFATTGETALAAGLEHEVAAALRTVPGLYVIADGAVSGYAHTDLTPAEIGEQLGARGIVDAAIELAEGRVRGNARLREAATGATLWRTEFDRPVDELRAVRLELAESIAATMLDAELRVSPRHTDGPVAAVAAASYSKPMQ